MTLSTAKDFKSLDLHPVLTKSLDAMGYDKPTPIQAEAIPLALKGLDIMGSAQTGTGKTAAFSIPLIQKLLTDPSGSALVMTPTRELGKQIMDIMHQLIGRDSGIKTAFIIGGEPMGKQFAQLRRNPRLIVGTPGRINDHLERGTLDLEDTKFLVLDETDRMLDMGFSIQLDRIAQYLPDERQTMMFSATLPKNIQSLSQKYLNNPQRVETGGNNVPVDRIQQDVVHVNDDRKYEELVDQLSQREGSVIIFVKTKFATERLAKRLEKEQEHEFRADAIHGDLKQARRSRVIKNFRDEKFRILVATDVVARGLDIPHIEHVVNYDLPQVPEDYVHRIGRTARAGAKGSALCLIAPQDRRKWRAIEQLIDPNASSSEGEQRSNGRGKARVEGAFGRKKFGQKKPFKSGKPRRENGRDGESFGDKKKSFGDRPRRNNDDKRSNSFGDKKKSFGDRPNRSEDSRRSDKPFRSDKPRRNNDENRGKSFGDKKKSYGERPNRSEEGRRSDKPFRSDKPRRNNDENRGKSFGDKKKSFGERPNRSDKPKRDGAFKGKKTYGEKSGNKSGGKEFGGYRKRKAA